MTQEGYRRGRWSENNGKYGGMGLHHPATWDDPRINVRLLGYAVSQ